MMNLLHAELWIGTMAILARMCGGGCYSYLLNKRGAIDDNGVDLGGIIPFISLAHLPEVLFGSGFALGIYHLTGSEWSAMAAVASFVAMEIGHGNAYHDGTEQFTFPDRFQTLDYIVRPMCRAITWVGTKLGFAPDLSPRSKWYCRVFMGTKGFLIGLPLLGIGTVALAVLWPLAYCIGFRWLKRASEPAEWISGAFAGLVIWATAMNYAWNFYAIH